MDGSFSRWKNNFKPTDIYTSQRLMLWLMFIAGYSPLQLTEERNGRRLRLSVIGYILCVTYASFNVICLIAMWPNGRLQSVSLILERTPLVDYAAFVKIVSVSITVPLLYIACSRMAKTMVTCMQHFAKVDKKLSLIGVDMDHSKRFKRNVFLIGFIITYLVIVLAMSTWHNGALAIKAKIMQQDEKKKDRIRDVDLTLWLLCVTHNISLVAMATVKCYYASIARQISERYKGMNRVSFGLNKKRENADTCNNILLP